MKITDYFKPKPHKPVDVIVQQLRKDALLNEKRQGSVKNTIVEKMVYDKAQKRKSPI